MITLILPLTFNNRIACSKEASSAPRVSSPQLDEAERGFSYHQDAPLDMRMDQSAPLTAYHVINEYSYHELVKIFFRYGEEKFSKQIAREIERVRKTKPIQTTGELVEIIKQVIPAPARRKGGHPAKRIFQAVRIAVNDELGAEEASLEQAIRLLKVNGRISVITFHSLEDRIVKSMFKRDRLFSANSSSEGRIGLRVMTFSSG